MEQSTQRPPRRLSFSIAALAVLLAAIWLPSAAPLEAQNRMPDESELHEGTWLQWPHHATYGVAYRNSLEPTWIAMTEALVQSENVHIIAYNAAHKRRIKRKLRNAGVPLRDVDFLIRKTDDTWVRDNGPIFVRDADGELIATDWGFNGWGLDAPYRRDDRIPRGVANRVGVPRRALNHIVLEGGAVEVDGRGVLMATRSSIFDPMRNPGLSEAQFKQIVGAELGIEKVIWLDGFDGGEEDITDAHIDGFARFADPDTIVAMKPADLRYWGLSNADIGRLFAASDRDGVPYDFIELPLTKHDVVTTYGMNLGYRGSYVNFYTANTVVLIPQYGDPHDALARNILQQAYPDRTVIGIDVRNLYREGGMVHCVTQQQPAW